MLPELLPVSRDKMALSYPELASDWERISTIAYAEEDAFRADAAHRHHDLRHAPPRTQKRGRHAARPASKAFALHDTYGFPIDLTLEMAAEQGLAVDEDGFRRLMTEQRDRAKADARAKKGRHADAGAYREVPTRSAAPVEFTGYDEVVSEGDRARHRRRRRRSRLGAARATRSSSCSTARRSTPRAAASSPTRASSSSATARASRSATCSRRSPGLIVHRARCSPARSRSASPARRWSTSSGARSITRAHTATHMVHKAFREALGETATQAGSENSPGRFRFDFSASGAVPQSAMADVEARVNDLVLADLAVHAEIMIAGRGACQSGAMALFGEKYGDRGAGDLRRRLGPRAVRRHARRPLRPARRGQAARRVARSAPAYDGSRRWSAATPTGSWPASTCSSRSSARRSRRGPRSCPSGSTTSSTGCATAEKEIERVRVQQLLAAAGELAAGREGRRRRRRSSATGADGAGAGDVRKLALDVRGRLPRGRPGVVAVVGSTTASPPSWSRSTTRRARCGPVGQRAGRRRARGALGGSGGGKDDVAQGGGADVLARRRRRCATSRTRSVARRAALRPA